MDDFVWKQRFSLASLHLGEEWDGQVQGTGWTSSSFALLSTPTLPLLVLVF
jgi:hypothetical protein